MDIDTKGKIDSKILAQVNTVFGSLTKEELIEKMVIDELNKLKYYHFVLDF